VKRHQAYKFELLATGVQQRDARRFAGACRFVFNKALALQEQHYNDGGSFIRYETMANTNPELN
jgi:putative transposase